MFLLSSKEKRRNQPRRGWSDRSFVRDDDRVQKKICSPLRCSIIVERNVGLSESCGDGGSESEKEREGEGGDPRR